MLSSNNCCQRTLVEQLNVDDVVLDALLPIVFCLMLSTLLVLNSANSILLMSGFIVELVVVHVLVANVC